MKFYQKKRKLSIWITAFAFVAAIILFRQILTALPAICSVLMSFLSILSPFIIGFAIAFVLYVPCTKFEKLYKKIKKPGFFEKHSRGLSILTVYILGIALIAIILVIVVPWLVKSIIGLYNNRVIYYDRVVDFINSKCDSDGKLFGFDTSSLIEAINPDKYLSNINLEQLTSIANGVYKFGSAIVEAVLAIFSSVYMLASRESLIRSVGRFFTLFASRTKVRKCYDYLCKICSIFYSYIYSALIDALVVAVACTVVFVIIGVDYAPIFGLIVGVSNLIPYFGAIISGVCVSVFTAVTDGFVKAIISAICILVIQQIDCNVLQPRIVGKNVGIHPLYTLMAITVGSGLFGFSGILIGVPVAATIQMIVTDILDRHDRRIAAASVSETADDTKDIPNE